jgi:hypothetical protein
MIDINHGPLVFVAFQPAVILSATLYGCETWFLTLKELGLRVDENKELRRIYGLEVR